MWAADEKNPGKSWNPKTWISDIWDKTPVSHLFHIYSLYFSVKWNDWLFFVSWPSCVRSKTHLRFSWIPGFPGFSRIFQDFPGFSRIFQDFQDFPGFFFIGRSHHQNNSLTNCLLFRWLGTLMNRTEKNWQVPSFPKTSITMVYPFWKNIKISFWWPYHQKTRPNLSVRIFFQITTLFSVSKYDTILISHLKSIMETIKPF